MSEAAKKDNVMPIRKDIDVEKIPAFISTFNVKLGGNRALTLQYPTAVDGNLQKAIGDALKAIDFHVARYELEELEDQLHTMEMAHKDHEMHLERILDNKELKALEDEGATYEHRHQNSGKKGDLRYPENYVARLTAAQQQHDNNKRQCEFQIKKSNIQMDRVRKQIAKRKKVIGASDKED